MSKLATRPKKTEAVTVGGIPKVDLLPPEVVAQATTLRVRKRALLAVIAVVAVVAIAAGYSAFVSFSAQEALASERQRTSTLLAEQLKYAEVRQVEQASGAVLEAQTVGAWSEVEWRGYLQQAQATAPAGITVKTVSAESAPALDVYPQPTVPLQGGRIGTLSFTANASDLAQVPAWLDALVTIPGFVDALPGPVTAAEGGGYDFAIFMHFGGGALSKRFLPEAADGDQPVAADTTTDAAGGSADSAAGTTKDGE